ncbi:hypothetical protein [Candidatus Coxiella mudrowiae]|uniref:hypothetical protein n=1 Tax=Candidatus Coxiella mudrowiae TaxID=2054173 RepID=UPI0012FEA50B|nr:hypothetical protein [Candidatus Coxiella mudrowiae]
MAITAGIRKSGLTLDILFESFSYIGVFNNPTISDSLKRKKAQQFIALYLFKNT